MTREYLKEGTYVRFPGGECYRLGGGIGEGGGSLLYSALRLAYKDGNYCSEGGIRYALKECFPFSRQFPFVRLPSGEVRPEKPSKEAEGYLRHVASMQLNEGQITSEIYATKAIRTVPIQQAAKGVELSFDQGKTFTPVANTFTVMASLEQKGESVAAWHERLGKLPAMGSLTVIREVLLALREVHRAGYLHLDLQEGNIFVAGDWKDQSVTCFLIDFGSARKLLEDGRCAENGSQPVFSSGGYRAPEITGILTGEDRDFRLGREADLYSVGYLLLFLLTGRHYGEETLAKLRTEYGGNYLTRKNLRELKIPAYVEELVQHTLSAALEEQPEKRYQSADEMLKDVDKLLEALAPYKPRNAGLSYDAYILYQAENELHKMAAETLQKRLERFRTPGLRRIRRVFLDSTELSADHNADKQLMEALKDSDYLIVVGGDQADEPVWRSKEVNFFLKHHAPSHVLAVVTGIREETDVLPVVKLGGGEKTAFLAADARGSSEREIRKKLKRDVALRLAAPMLSMPYDGLVQRYRRYLRRKFGTIAAALFLLVAGFTGYALYQTWQRELAQALAEKDRARNLCAAAMQQYERGDKKAALETLLLSFDGAEHAEDCVVPEQVYALNTMLNTYASGHTTAFVPEDKITEKFSEVAFSDGQGYLYGLDKNGQVEVILAETNAVIWTIRPEMLWEGLPDPEGEASFGEDPSQIRFACPLGEEKALVVSDTLAAVADVRTQTIEKAFSLAETLSSTPVYAVSESRFAYRAASQEVYVYNYITGEQEACLSWESDEFGQRLSGISFAADGSRLAFGTTAGVWVYDVRNGTEKKITGTAVCDVEFMESGKLAVMEYEELPEDPVRIGDFWDDTKYSYTPVLYDGGTGARLSCGNTQNGYPRDEKGMASVWLLREGEETEVWASWMRGDLRLVDAESGMLMEEVSYHSDIVAVESTKDGFILVGLSDGSVRLLRMLGNALMRRSVCGVGEELCDIFYDSKGQKLVLHTENGVVFCRRAIDPDMTSHDTEEFVYDMKYLPSEETGGYRAVWFAGGLFDRNGFALYSTADDTLQCSYQCGEEWAIEDVRTCVIQGEEWLLLLERSTDYQTYKIKKAAVSDPEKTEECDLSFVEEAEISVSWGMGPMVYGPDLESVYVPDRAGRQLLQVNLAEKTVMPMPALESEEEEILDMSLHGDGELLYILSVSPGQMKLYGYSLPEKRVTAKQAFVYRQNTKIWEASIVKNRGETLLAVYDQERTVYLLDAKDLQIRQTIEVGKQKELQLCFIRGDTCLLGADKETVWVYVPEEERTAATYPLDQSLGAGLKLSADWEQPFFCLQDSSVYENPRTDDGISTQQLHIFFIDEKLQIYPFADVVYGYKMPDSPYVMSVYENRFGYVSGELYDFSDLYEKAANLVR